MKWVNHKLIAGATGYALTGNIAFTAASILFSTVPDSIEFHNYKTGTSVFKHRGNSHNPLVWLIAFAVLYIGFRFILPYSVIQIDAIISTLYPNLVQYVPSMLVYSFFGMVYGVFIHLITDAMTMGGIPVGKRHHFALRWFYTGSSQEYLTSFSIVAVSIFISIVI